VPGAPVLAAPAGLPLGKYCISVVELGRAGVSPTVGTGTGIQGV